MKRREVALAHVHCVGIVLSQLVFVLRCYRLRVMHMRGATPALNYNGLQAYVRLNWTISHVHWGDA